MEALNDMWILPPAYSWTPHTEDPLNSLSDQQGTWEQSLETYNMLG